MPSVDTVKDLENLVEKLRNAKTLIFDYDGTIAPLNVPRSESKVYPEIYDALSRLSHRYMIAIATTKDCNFVIRRTPFATLWICSNGFEIRYKDLSIVHSSVLDRYEDFLMFLQLVYRIASDLDIEIKYVGRVPVGVCVDWRWRGKPEDARKVVEISKSYGFHVVEYPGRPFVDIFVYSIDKGWALTKCLELGIIRRPIVYFGDSENDVPAFRIADVSIQLVHDENKDLDLGAQYRIEREVLFKLLELLSQDKD